VTRVQDRNIFTISLIIMILTGCTSSSENITGPSGKTTHQTKCTINTAACFKQATKTCKGSYQVLDSSSNAGRILADIILGPVTWYKMSYQCGTSDGQLPTFEFKGSQYIPPVPTTTTCDSNGSVTCRSF
jgi:hypothetical protein